MKKFIVFFLLLSGTAYAAPSTSIVTPNSFTPNTTIQSSQVNSNFTEVQNKYNVHTHTDITALGSVTSGSWLAGVIATNYGGTGQDFSSVAKGSVIYFDPAGTMTTLAPGTAGQILTTNGTGFAPSWGGGGSADSMICTGFEISTGATTKAIIASPGVLFVGATGVNMATSYTLYLDNNASWSSGTAVTYAAGANWCYVGVASTGIVRLMGNNAPQYSDLNGSRGGTKIYSIEYSNGVYYRIIGAFRVTAADIREQSWTQTGNYIQWDQPISLTTTVNTGFTSLDCKAAIPRISKRGTFGFTVAAVGNTSECYIRPRGSSSLGYYTPGSNYANGISMDHSALGSTHISGEITTMTDESQYIDYDTGGGNSCEIRCKGFYLNIR